MKKYDHKKIEKKWQQSWKKSGIYTTKETKGKPKCFVLDMFPYPSGSGLHVGHPKGYIATDVFARFKTMSGFNVLHPMGWDAFGLPAEQYAIKNKIHPAKSVAQNVKRYKEQLSVIGLNYDWEREINTTDPEYYKWTQWTFLQMFKKGLAFESNEPINWCPSCKTGLANEDLEDGRCERCGSIVEKRPLRQWVLRITKYADRLLEDLDALNWPQSIKQSQRNWIGRSEGAEVEFKIKETEDSVNVFTTRVDTLFGVTYIVIAPEHSLLQKWQDDGLIKNTEKVSTYIAEVKGKTEIERTAEGKEKTGVELKGILAINPATGEEVPVWTADYVLADYGTGIVMAVPAHDERDFVFAKKYKLQIKNVIEPITGVLKENEICTDDGLLAHSGAFDGISSEVAREKFAEKFGKKVIKYKLRDWTFSRQRYWGEPIPLIHCANCGVVAVPENELPLKLPNVKSYEPTGTGESPLANISKWVNVKCPECNAPAKRETNTMPQWAGSCWYYLRFIDPKNKKALIDPKKEKYWMPVDMYVGGAEHATRHLIYARFWHKFLYDIGVVSTGEPFMQLKNQGLIAGPDGKKMSKRDGNVVNPDDVINTYGADTFRVYEMFIGPFEQGASWNTDNMIGSRRFIEKVWRLLDKVVIKSAKKDAVHISKEIEVLINKTIKKVTEDIESFSPNTSVSTLMILTNALEKEERISKSTFEILLKLLAPLAPHVTEELWAEVGNKKSIHLAPWPQCDESKLESGTFKIVVQINGKVRATFETETDNEKEVTGKALALPEISSRIGDKTPSRVVYIKGKLVNIVVQDS